MIRQRRPDHAERDRSDRDAIDSVVRLELPRELQTKQKRVMDSPP